MRARFAQTVTAAMDRDERIVVVIAEIGAREFAHANRRHPDRVVNVGIREQAMVGVAAGLALEGFRPVVHSYAPFLVERPYEQIKLDFAHQGVGGVFVSIGGSYDAAGEGRTHQAPEDVVLMATIPGMHIHVPGHPDEAEDTISDALAGDGLDYIRLSSRANAAAHPSSGRMSVVRHAGPDAPVVIAVGPMLDATLAATEHLGATVLYTTTVRPFDTATLRPFATRDVAVVEPTLEGTSVHEITAALPDRPHRLMAIGVPNAEHRRYGTPQDHDRAHGLDVPGIARRLEEFFGSRRAERP